MKKIKVSKFSHGGGIYQVAEKYGISPEEIIDFSANVNPWGTSLGLEKIIKENLQSIFRYPDTYCRKLTLLLSNHLGIACDNILVGNGATEIIYLAMRAVKPRYAVIPVPTFSEYERALKLAGGQVKFLYLKERQGFSLNVDALIEKAKKVQMIILCNPNNPTGNLLPGEEMDKIINNAEKKGIATLLDESFIDFQPEFTLVDKLKKNKNLIILRSFTKFFSIAGLRLGYAVADKSLISKIKSFKEPWTVNCLAEVAGIHILKNLKRAEGLREKTKRERSVLYENLCRIKGIKPYPSQANFILIKIKASISSSYLTEELAKGGILVRDCSNFSGLGDKFIRVAVRKKEENRKLICSLNQILTG
ncbi:threonine-phosphate decarboxylase [Candidatus Aerophobetes bacterium]|nr:threonine-phosphate decarboxylase [Candidatus Aerophobetes bacterium]